MTGVGLGGETPLEAEMADTGTEEQGGEDEYHHHLLAPRQKEHRVRINRVRDHASAGRDGTGECKNISVNWKSATSFKEPPLG
jgi:hypothetical protein